MADFSKIKFIDVINPKKWMSVIRAFLNRDIYAQHIVEQIMFRYLECEPCVKNGSCLHCGCSLKGSLNKMSDLQAEDSDGKWGKVMPEEDWQSYKILNNIKFSLTTNF